MYNDGEELLWGDERLTLACPPYFVVISSYLAQRGVDSWYYSFYWSCSGAQLLRRKSWSTRNCATGLIIRPLPPFFLFSLAPWCFSSIYWFYGSAAGIDQDPPGSLVGLARWPPRCFLCLDNNCRRSETRRGCPDWGGRDRANAHLFAAGPLRSVWSAAASREHRALARCRAVVAGSSDYSKQIKKVVFSGAPGESNRGDYWK